MMPATGLRGGGWPACLLPGGSSSQPLELWWYRYGWT